MSEKTLCAEFCKLRDAYLDRPTYTLAQDIHRIATELCAISDDHISKRDEADDILTDYS